MSAVFRNTLLSLLGIFLPVAAKASTPLSPGDIAVVFYSFEGSVVEPDTYVLNLGSGALFRENTLRGVSITTINPAITNDNIGTDLTTTFGSDWAERGTVRWTVVGIVASTDPTTNGDPARTAYFSRARETITPGAIAAGTTIPNISAANRGAISTQLLDFFNGTNNAIALAPSSSTSGSNSRGTIIPTFNNNSFEDFVPPVKTGLYFGQGVDPRQTLVAGAIAGGTGVEGALDIYRILHSTAGADLTAGQSSGDAVVGQGQFIGTLTIDAAGNLKIGAEGGSPAENYESWAAANNVTGGPGGDSDNDGILNLVEYALDLNLTGSDGSPGTFSGGAVSFTKRPAAVTNGDVTYVIETSDDLGVTLPWTPVTSGVTNDATLISYTLPSGKTKTFARLRVTSN